MCGAEETPTTKGDGDPQGPFPWDVPIYDAHCHPTDTMSSIERIPSMKARVLTIMATRSQDQDLVASVAAEKGIASQEELSAASTTNKVIPAFGWHPWFSYQLIDDTTSSMSLPPADDAQAIWDFKSGHYSKVLSPTPEDKDFIMQLPVPKLLSTFIGDTKARLEAHPAAMVGEIGIDRSFRLPDKWTAEHESQRDETLTPGGREGRRLSPYHVIVDHQTAVLKAQLALAGGMIRPVSIHGVAAHGVLYDIIASTWKGHEKDVVSSRERKRIAPNAEDWTSSDEESDDEGFSSKPRIPKRKPAKRKALKPMPFPPRICLHSFSSSVEVLSRYLKRSVPAKIYFSFSCFVNLSTESTTTRLTEVLKAIPDNRILVESDSHMAGEEMDGLLEEVTRVVCKLKGWGLREGVEKLGRNYEEFVFG